MGRSLVLRGALEGRVDLALVVAAAADAADLLVGEHRHDVRQLLVVLHPVLAHFLAAGDRVHLVVAVHGAFHALLQHAVRVDGEQRVPFAAPDDLDDVPAGAAEAALQLLDDFAVAAHRAVEPLQVAVDHQDQVVEPFAGGDVDGAQHFRFVGLAVADEGPDLAAVGRFQAAVLQVLGEAGLVDALGVDRPIEAQGACQKSGMLRGCG